MRKFKSILLLLVLAFSMIAFIGCEVEERTEDLIIGEWELVHSAGWEIDHGVKTVWNERRSGLFWGFYEDGTGYVEDTTIPNSVPAFFTWRVSDDDRLIVNSSGQVFRYDIDELDFSRMVIDVEMYDVNYEGEWTETYLRVR